MEGHVPFAWQYRRPGGPCCAAMVCRTAPDVRAHHVFGNSDPEGFAAMGVVEILVHMDSVAAGLGVGWHPPADLCDRALARLFPPAAPADTDRWQTLL